MMQFLSIFGTRKTKFGTMASRSKSIIFLHVVEDEQRGVMDIWCTNGLRRVRGDPSITRGGLDADQWCVRISMRSPTVYGKKICGGAWWPPKATSHGCFFSKVGNYVSSTEPQNRYIQITTKPRTQGIISQTLLGGGGLHSVGRKDPRGFLCVCPEGRDARNSYGISFRTHSK